MLKSSGPLVEQVAYWYMCLFFVEPKDFLYEQLSAFSLPSRASLELVYSGY